MINLLQRSQVTCQVHLKTGKHVHLNSKKTTRRYYHLSHYLKKHSWILVVMGTKLLRNEFQDQENTFHLWQYIFSSCGWFITVTAVPFTITQLDFFKDKFTSHRLVQIFLLFFKIKFRGIHSPHQMSLAITQIFSNQTTVLQIKQNMLGWFCSINFQDKTFFFIYIICMKIILSWTWLTVSYNGLCL